jgi:CHAT domain-containing protein
MIDWSQFHAATTAATRPVVLASACARAWRWLDLAPDAQEAAVTGAIHNEGEARTTAEALWLVWTRVWREAGVDTGDGTRFQAALDDLAAGRASNGVVVAARRTASAVTMRQLVLARYPGATLDAAAADRALLNGATPAVSAAVGGVGLGVVTSASLAALADAIASFEPLSLEMQPATRRDHAWWMGLAWWAMGRGAQELARHAEAHEAFERAAGFYDHAGEAATATQCRQLARDLDLRLSANLDAAATPIIEALLADQDPLPRAAALTRLSAEVGRAGDRFEAASLGEQAATVLDRVGYPDPEPSFDSALQQWIATASATRHGSELFAHLCDVTGHWAQVMGARVNWRQTHDPAGSARAERTLRGLGALPEELSREADRATQDALERFAVWMPGATSLATGRSRDAPADPTVALTELDDALHALRVACNEGASPFQIDEADQLLARADDLHSRIHAARALTERAYVLLALGRHAAVPAAADAAIQRLLDGQTARLGAFATGYERELYLMAVAYKARAFAARKDSQAILEVCVPVLRDIETERRRVSSPYQQSAFLATRTEIYEMVAAAAFKVGDRDVLLATTELLKARAALSSRRVPPGEIEAEGAVAEILEEWRSVSEALVLAAPGSADESALRERRRWLSMLVAMQRMRHASVPSEITVADIQGALAPDEAAISWFLIGADTVLVQAITRDDDRVATITLGDAQQGHLRAYLACLTAFGNPEPPEDEVVTNLTRLVDELGSVLVPAEIRDLVDDRRRLILSPHRTLHLFPFHAVPWPRGNAPGRLIERFAVRHAPNLTSLTLPWQGTDSGRVLAVGVSEFDDPGMESLPDAEAEATEVAGVHGALGEVLLGASRSEFLERIKPSRYRCLHLATHGSSVLADEALDDPLQSCLSLRDGALTAWDLSTIDLPAEMVVLAACHSGQRAVAGRGLESLPGDDLFGLQAVLFDAGVWGVLGTLWPVGDETARAIMVDVHQAYASGLAPDLALQSAIRAHLASEDRFREVFDWAPFFLTVLGRRGESGGGPPRDS